MIKRRTLLVGLGGTGRDTITYLLRKIKEKHGTIKELPLSCVLFDLDTLPTYNEEDADMLRPYFQQLDQSQVNDKVRYMHLPENEPYRSWYPDADGKFIDIREIKDGAGQWRPVGRVGYTENRLVIETRFVDAINKLLEYPDHNLDNKDIDVYLVSSIAGGTGSGLIQDLAFYLQDAHTRRDSKIRIRTYAFLVMPELFANVALKERIFPNAYAALKEIRAFFLKDANFSGYYPGFGHFEIDTKQTQPFERIYLIDKETGTTQFTHPQQCFRFLAYCLYIRISSHMQSMVKSVLTNVEYAASDKNPHSAHQVFSTLGAAMIRIPSTKNILFYLLKRVFTIEGEGYVRETSLEEAIRKLVQKHVNDLLQKWFEHFSRQIQEFKKASKEYEGSKELRPFAFNYSSADLIKDLEREKKAFALAFNEILNSHVDIDFPNNKAAIPIINLAFDELIQVIENARGISEKKTTLGSVENKNPTFDRIKNEFDRLIKAERQEASLESPELDDDRKAILPFIVANKQFVSIQKNEVDLLNSRIPTDFFTSFSYLLNGRHADLEAAQNAPKGIINQYLEPMQAMLENLGMRVDMAGTAEVAKGEGPLSGVDAAATTDVYFDKEFVKSEEKDRNYLPFVQAIESIFYQELVNASEKREQAIEEKKLELQNVMGFFESKLEEGSRYDIKAQEEDEYSNLNELTVADFFEQMSIDSAVIEEIVAQKVNKLVFGKDEKFKIIEKVQIISVEELKNCINEVEDELVMHLEGEKLEYDHTIFVKTVEKVLRKAKSQIFVNLKNVTPTRLVYYSLPENLLRWFKPKYDSESLQDAIKVQIQQVFGGARPEFFKTEDDQLVFYQEEHHQPSENISGIIYMQKQYQNIAFPQTLLHINKEYPALPELIEPEFKVVLCGNHGCDFNISGVPRETHFCPNCSNPILNRCGNIGCMSDNLLHLIGGKPDPAKPICPSCNNKIKTIWWKCDNNHGLQYRDPKNKVCPDCANEVAKNEMLYHKQSFREGDNVFQVFCIHCQENDRITTKFKLPMPEYYFGVPSYKRNELLIHLSDSRVQDNNCPECGSKLYPECPYPEEHSQLQFLEEKATFCNHQYETKKVWHCHHCEYPVNEHTTSCPRCHYELRECSRCSTEANQNENKQRYKVTPVVLQNGEEICPNCQYPLEDQELYEQD